MTTDTLLTRIDTDMPHAIERLLTLLRMPSISTDPAYRPACRAAAEWLAEDLRTLGAEATIHDTPGHPMVVGQIDGPGPHLLFYGHYDVQPVDPIELWHNDPFDPKIEPGPAGDIIRGRGSSDDKGQLMTFVEACRAYKAEHGRLPCKITFFFEGEEESGSPSLVPFMEQNKDLLRADIALICDTGMFQSRTPSIVTMLRGLLGEELIITGPDKDLHSGMYGGVSINPARVLVRLLASLHDDSGRVTVPGFYDDVAELSDDLRAQWQALDFDHARFLGDVGLSLPAGETGRMPIEMIWSRPTCEINGIWSGYTGEGFKTVLPSKASAKVSFRLVPGQDPLKIRAAFRDMVRAALPADCSVEFRDHGASRASVMATDNPLFETARQALSEEWPDAAAFVGCGGSIPIAGHFKSILGMDAMLIGFAKDDDQIHSPNEKYDVESFRGGIRSWARFLEKLQ